MNTFQRAAAIGSAFVILTPHVAFAEAKPSKGQQMQVQASSEVPHCARKLGTLSIVDGDDPRGWTQYNLASPQKVLRAIVQRSGCFNLVDRGAGLGAAEKERNIGGNLGLQRGSNVGQGQVKAADYVLVAEVQGGNANSSGAAAGIAGALIGGRAGALIGGIKTKKVEANTVLSLTNVRTTETMSVQEGYAVKNDVSWGAGGGSFGWGGVVGGGYEDTDIGRIVTLAFINAYSKMVGDLGILGDAPAAASAPQKTFVTMRETNLRATPDAKGSLIRALDPGMSVYPTGKKQDAWWEVADENDNVGWVLNTALQPGK